MRDKPRCMLYNIYVKLECEISFDKLFLIFKSFLKSVESVADADWVCCCTLLKTITGSFWPKYRDFWSVWRKCNSPDPQRWQASFSLMKILLNKWFSSLGNAEIFCCFLFIKTWCNRQTIIHHLLAAKIVLGCNKISSKIKVNQLYSSWNKSSPTLNVRYVEC